MQVSERGLRRLAAGAWTAAAATQFAVGLSRELATWDEQIYFDVAQNVLDGYWLLPRFALESHPLPAADPFLHKPPLVYWIHAASMLVAGETPAVARTTSVLAMSGVVGLTVLLTWRLSGPTAGLLSGWLALEVPAFAATHGANDVATDPFLLFFGVGAVYCLVVHVETGRTGWAWLAGVGYGAAILAKSVAAAPFGLFVLPYLYRHRRRVGWRGFGRVVAGGVLTAAPWFLAAAVLAVDELVEQMFLRQVVARATGAQFVEREAAFAFMRYPYFARAADYFGWPVYGLGIAGLLALARRALTEQWRDVDVLMWPLAVGVVVLYAVVGGNHLWYVMPAGVPIVVLTSDVVTAIVASGWDRLEDYG